MGEMMVLKLIPEAVVKGRSTTGRCLQGRAATGVGQSLARCRRRKGAAIGAVIGGSAGKAS